MREAVAQLAVKLPAVRAEVDELILLIEELQRLQGSRLAFARLAQGDLVLALQMARESATAAERSVAEGWHEMTEGGYRLATRLEEVLGTVARLNTTLEALPQHLPEPLLDRVRRLGSQASELGEVAERLQPVTRPDPDVFFSKLASVTASLMAVALDPTGVTLLSAGLNSVSTLAPQGSVAQRLASAIGIVLHPLPKVVREVTRAVDPTLDTASTGVDPWLMFLLGQAHGPTAEVRVNVRGTDGV